MDLDDFEAALDDFGADVEDWPADLRSAARLLLDQSADARQLLEDELRLSAAFAMRPTPKAPAGLADRIVFNAMLSDTKAAAPQLAKAEKVEWSMASFWGALADIFPPPRYRYALALSVCFAFGVVGSQFMAQSDDYGSSLYVSSIYADLAY